MNFGQAIEAMKDGARVARCGWNGKGMWLRIVPPSGGAPFGALLTSGKHADREAHRRPYIEMKDATDQLVPWLASQTDMLADDWAIVEDNEMAAGREKSEAATAAAMSAAGEGDDAAVRAGLHVLTGEAEHAGYFTDAGAEEDVPKLGPSLGEIAFAAYRLDRQGTNHDGSATPLWGALGDEVRQGWEAAAKAVANRVLPTPSIADFATEYVEKMSDEGGIGQVCEAKEDRTWCVRPDELPHVTPLMMALFAHVSEHASPNSAARQVNEALAIALGRA